MRLPCVPRDRASAREKVREGIIFRMHTRILRFWEAHALDPQRPVLAGISGGADSTALLAAVRAAGLPLIAAHLDHALRPESGQDAAAVERLCRRLDVPLVVERRDAGAYARRESLSLEDAARRLRYRFLFGLAERLGAQAVLVAHTADDQVETLLMHLLTGSGLRGLGGMLPYALPNAWSASIPLARPLLDVSRAEVLAYCRARGLPILEDASNRDTRFLRNRLRRELLPLLETYNPQVRAALLRAASILAEAEAAIGQWAASAQALHPCGEHCLQLDESALAALPSAVQRRVLRQAFLALGGDLREIGFDGLEAARRFCLERRTAGEHTLPGRLRLLRESDGLWALAEEGEAPRDAWPQMADTAPRNFAVPGVFPLESGWELTARWVAPAMEGWEAARKNRDPFRAWLDLGETRPPLKVRPRLPGDSLEPLGMPGHSVKIGDLMTNAKVPRRVRARWPLVCVGERIAWLPGLRVAHPFRVRRDSRKVLLLTCRRKS